MQATEKKKFQGENSYSVVAIRFIGSILPATVLNSFRRGSLFHIIITPSPHCKLKDRKEFKNNQTENEQETYGSVQRDNRHTDQSHL